MRAGDYNTGHVTTRPLPDNLVIPKAEVFSDPEFATSDPALNDAEIELFKTYGYIVKRRLIDDAALFRKVVDHVWNNVPRGFVRRDDPRSWVDAPNQNWTEEDSVRVGHFANGSWKMRSRGNIGTERFLVDGIANHPSMRAVAESFIGRPVKSCERVRGIYCVFPHQPDQAGRYAPHADYMAAHLAAMVIADPIPARAGAFTVWPGSHLRMHNHWDTLHGGIISQDKAAGHCEERDAILRDVTPVELPGDAGDVIFWHPRLIRSAGINQSASWGEPLVRVIVPCDYQRADREVFDDLEFGPGPKYQWWLDTRNYCHDRAPTPENIWNDWAI